jgi:hypothetical protein
MLFRAFRLVSTQEIDSMNISMTCVNGNDFVFRADLFTDLNHEWLDVNYYVCIQSINKMLQFLKCTFLL